MISHNAAVIPKDCLGGHKQTSINLSNRRAVKQKNFLEDNVVPAGKRLVECTVK